MSYTSEILATNNEMFLASIGTILIKCKHQIKKYVFHAIIVDIGPDIANTINICPIVFSHYTMVLLLIPKTNEINF